MQSNRLVSDRGLGKGLGKGDDEFGVNWFRLTPEMLQQQKIDRPSFPGTHETFYCIPKIFPAVKKGTLGRGASENMAMTMEKQ